VFVLYSKYYATLYSFWDHKMHPASTQTRKRIARQCPSTAAAAATTTAINKYYCHRHRYHLCWILPILTILFSFPQSTFAFDFPFHNSQPPPTTVNNNKNNNNDNTDNTIMRAWTCHGKNQWDLVDHLRQANIVKTSAVTQVLQQVDRANYIPADGTGTGSDSTNPYMDTPQSIGLGQTISAPHMHAHVLEEIYPSLVGKSDVRMLDVGCGSGYLTAALGRWVHNRPGENGPHNNNNNNNNNILGVTSGKVFGIDVRQHLVDLTRRNIGTEDKDLFDDGIVEVSLRDGWVGLPEEAPFDAIHVGAAAESMPYQLLQQLKLDGVLIVPIGKQEEPQTLYKIQRIHQSSVRGTRNRSMKNNNGVDDYGTFDLHDFHVTTLLGVRYVPLVRVDNN
jgi:protein-L-isoaspartate(D-aspartate) O-methyltransferase